MNSKKKWKILQYIKYELDRKKKVTMAKTGKDTLILLNCYINSKYFIAPACSCLMQWPKLLWEIPDLKLYIFNL